MLEGVYDITVTATDPAGNTSPESPILEVTIDVTGADVTVEQAV